MNKQQKKRKGKRQKRRTGHWSLIIVLLMIGIAMAQSFRMAEASETTPQDRQRTTETRTDDSNTADGKTKDGKTANPQTANDQTLSLGLPQMPAGTEEQILYRKGYVTSYNKANRIPNWVAWTLTAEHTEGTVKRPGTAFHEDGDVPAPRATHKDYRGSGWSRGHMCPAGDNRWDEEAMYESFLLTNCCPQHSNLNSGEWNRIEMLCRRWAKKYGRVTIVCGPVLMNQQHATIGRSGVVVPEAFFKVVVAVGDEPHGIGFVCRNAENDRKRALHVNTIRQVERMTGITFFPNLPQDVSRKVKATADVQQW